MRLQPQVRTARRAATVVLLALATVGCAAADPGLPTAQPDPSTLGSVDPGATAASDALPGPGQSAASTDPAVAWPAYTACLRAHGIDVPDPVIDANGEVSFDTTKDFKRLLTRTTERDCGPLIAALTQTGGRRPHSYTFESEVAQAACLRDHGLTQYPDPDPDDPGGLAPGYDKADATVLAALVACEGALVEQAASPSPVP